MEDAIRDYIEEIYELANKFEGTVSEEKIQDVRTALIQTVTDVLEDDYNVLVAACMIGKLGAYLINNQLLFKEPSAKELS
jgi:hypothetical protein